MEMNRLTIDEELGRLRGGCCKADKVAQAKRNSKFTCLCGLITSGGYLSIYRYSHFQFLNQ